jgi:quinol monooxygenase YgiN
MRGRRRRDDGWDEGHRDSQDSPRDSWQGANGYQQDATASRPAAGYANGMGYAGQDGYTGQGGYAGQDGYGRQSHGGAQGYDSRGYEPNGYGDAAQAYGGARPESGAYPGGGQATSGYAGSGYAGNGYSGAGYDRAGYPGGGYDAPGYAGYGQGGPGLGTPGYDQRQPDNGYAPPGYGGYGSAGAFDQVNGAPAHEFAPADETASANEYGAGTGRPYGRLSIFTLLDDKAAEFDRLAERAAEGVRTAEPDTLVYVIHVVPKAPMQRIIYEIYRDRAGFESHERQPHIQRFVADRRSCVLATNIIDLRLKYAKVAALGAPQAAPMPLPGSGSSAALPAAAAAAGSQWNGDGANGHYQASGQYPANAQYPANGQYAAGTGDGRYAAAGGGYSAPANGQYPANRQYEANGQYTGVNGQYTGANGQDQDPFPGTNGRAPRTQSADRDRTAYRAGRHGGS